MSLSEAGVCSIGAAELRTARRELRGAGALPERGAWYRPLRRQGREASAAAAASAARHRRQPVGVIAASSRYHSQEGRFVRGQGGGEGSPSRST